MPCISGSLPHKYKIIIAGNHELSFDPKFTCGSITRQHHKTAHTGNVKAADILFASFLEYGLTSRVTGVF